jgi:hypothetical protein
MGSEVGEESQDAFVYIARDALSPPKQSNPLTFTFYMLLLMGMRKV